MKDAVFEYAVTLLEDEAEIYRYCVSFPEFFYPIEERLRKFSKAVANTKWRAILRGYFQRISTYSRAVVEEREKPSNKGKSLMAWANELESCLPFKNGKKIEIMRERYNRIIKNRFIQSNIKNKEIDEEEIILDLNNKSDDLPNDKNLEYRGGVRDALLDTNNKKNKAAPRRSNSDSDDDEDQDDDGAITEDANDEDGMISDNDSSQHSQNDEDDMNTIEKDEEDDDEEDLVQDMNWSSDDEN